MEYVAKSTDDVSRHKRIIFVAIAIAGVAVFMAVVYSGFSTGSIGTIPSNPFGAGEGPPEISMVHQGTEYDGELLGYVWGEQTSLAELPQVSRENVTAVSQQNVVEVQKGSELRFDIVGNRPPESPSDSLAVTAFTQAGEPVAVLDANASPGNNTYSTGSLEAGNQYVLISTATWQADEQQQVVTGYVVYGHRVSIVE